MSVDQDPAASDGIQNNSVRCAFNEMLKVNVVVFLFEQIQGHFWPKVRPIDSIKYIAQNLRRGDNALLHKLKSLLGCTVERGNNLIGGWSCFLLIAYVFNVHVLNCVFVCISLPIEIYRVTEFDQVNSKWCNSVHLVFWRKLKMAIRCFYLLISQHFWLLQGLWSQIICPSAWFAYWFGIVVTLVGTKSVQDSEKKCESKMKLSAMLEAQIDVRCDVLRLSDRTACNAR